ncbi:hypothetical protein [Dongia deserti]|uniref:hypothetical protein n=1 Tax=Dongia deserti TaxID=2268030 RepID=UPI000E647220|nr:hypothetical protein [Dongia deserti]
MKHRQGVTSSQVIRVLWCVGLAFSIGFGSTHALAQSQLDRCLAPILAPSEPIDPASFWNDDREILAWRRQDGDRYAYRIAGDIVELTPRSFAALATAPGEVLDDVSEISIEAREIIVAMPIRLANGTIKLQGDAVRFTGDAAITLVDPPTERHQSVEIIAGTLDLSRAPDMPFMFPTQGWILNGPPQWPAADGPKRMLRVNARTIVPPTDASEAALAQLKDDPLRWFHNKTADQGFDSGLPKSVWSAGYDIAIGESAGTIYDGLFGATLVWPDLAVAKLARLHARAPFDLVVGAFVRAKIDELSPRLARRASQQAIATLDMIRAQMALGIDPFGHGPNEVPMTGLSERLKSFQKSLDTTFGTGKKAGALALWDDTRLAVLAAGKLVDPAKQVDQIDRILRTQSADRAAAAQRIGSNSEKLLKMVQDGHAKITEAVTIYEVLLGQYTAERAQAASFGRIVDDLFAYDTVIGIGRPAAAPYSLVSTPEVTKPVSYYGSKDTEQPAGAPTDLREIASRYRAYALLLADFEAAWKAADPHVAPALGHLTGKQKNDAELAAFGTSMATVHEKADSLRAGLPNGPAEFTLPLNDYTPVDEEQQKKSSALLQEAEAIMASAGTLQAMILADTRRLRAIDADLRWLSAVRDDLLTLKSLPAEDGVQRQVLISSLMSARLLADVTRSANLLRKGFYYVTGRQISMPDQALYPMDDVLTAAGLDLRRPEQYDGLEMKAALQAERTALKQYYEGFAGGLAEQAGAFVDRNPATPPTVEFFRAAYESDISHNLQASYLRARFLESVNRSIAAQIRLGRAGAGFASHPILIPISITPPGPSGGAQFLLGAAVTKVHFEGDPKMASRIDLRIEHPRWGTVTIDGNCHRVIDALDDSGAIVTGFAKTISIPREVKPDWRESVPTDQAFAKILDNAFPLDAPYYLYVEVAQASGWKQPPVIDEIEILFVKTGTQLQ